MLSRVQRWQSTPCPTALNAVGARVFERKACARARSSGLRGSSGPLRGKGRSGRTQGASDPYGGSEASAVNMELPFYRDTWRLRTLPQAGNGSGAVGLVREEPDPWAWLLRPFHAVTDNYAGFALLQYEWVSLL